MRRKGTADSLWRALADRTDAGRKTVLWALGIPSLDTLRLLLPKVEAERSKWESARPGGADAMLIVAYLQSHGKVRLACNELGC